MEWSFTEREVRLGLLGLHVTVAERGGGTGGRTLLMLHDIGEHGDAWRPVVRELEGVSRVVCPDLRGHGRSDWTRGGYWLQDNALDMKGLLDHLGVDDVVVVGHGIGSRVAMVLAPLLEDRLSGLVLLDLGPEFDTAGANETRDRISTDLRVMGLGSEDALADFLRGRHPDFTAEQLSMRAQRRYRLNWAGKIVLRNDPEVYWILGRAGLQETGEMWAGMRAAKAPALVVRGTRSVQLEKELALRMVAALPDGRYREVDLGHFMHYQDPAGVAGILNELCAEIDG